MGSDNLYWFKKRGQTKRKDKLIQEYRDSLLIICEGKKTEPNYFKSFQTSGVKVKIIGKGKNTLSLVEDAIKEWEISLYKGEYFEQLWCVFDKDDFPLQNYNQAFKTVITEEKRINKKFKKKIGKEISVKIAYSNEAFELWYLLHYDYITTGISRDQYKVKLTERLGETYKKNDPKMYDKLKKLSEETKNKKGQEFAINNAKKLRKLIKRTDKHNHNPSTSVDLLVIELNKHLKQ